MGDDAGCWTTAKIKRIYQTVLEKRYDAIVGESNRSVIQVLWSSTARQKELKLNQSLKCILNPQAYLSKNRHVVQDRKHHCE